MKTPTIISDDLRAEIMALVIPKHCRCRHNPRLNTNIQSRQYVCGQKRQYTYKYAQEVVKRFRRFYTRIMQAYRCRYCQHWHVGRSSENNS